MANWLIFATQQLQDLIVQLRCIVNFRLFKAKNIWQQTESPKGNSNYREAGKLRLSAGVRLNQRLGGRRGVELVLGAIASISKPISVTC